MRETILLNLLEQALYKLQDCKETMVENGLTNLDREWWRDLCDLTKDMQEALDGDKQGNE